MRREVIPKLGSPASLARQRSIARSEECSTGSNKFGTGRSTRLLPKAHPGLSTGVCELGGPVSSPLCRIWELRRVCSSQSRALTASRRDLP
jgi:hypothetical protein